MSQDTQKTIEPNQQYAVSGAFLIHTYNYLKDKDWETVNPMQVAIQAAKPLGVKEDDK